MLIGPQLLQSVYLANATFSAFCGLMMLIFGDDLQLWLGLPNSGTWYSIASGLLVFSGYLILLSLRQPVKKADALSVGSADLLWVFVSASLLLIFPALFSPSGKMLVAIIAVIVSLFALLQLSIGRKLQH